MSNQISGRDIELLRSSQQLLGNNNESIQERESRERLADVIQGKVEKRIGESTFDQGRNSYLHHKTLQGFKNGLVKGESFTEDIKYGINSLTSREEMALRTELEPLKAIEDIVGYEQFVSFCEQQNSQQQSNRMRVVDPEKQFSLDESGRFNFVPAISPVEIERASKASFLLGDKSAEISIQSIKSQMQASIGKSWDELSRNDPHTPIIAPGFKQSDYLASMDSVRKLSEISKDFGSSIVTQLDQYRRQGGDKQITSSDQISIAPNADGSLKLADGAEPRGVNHDHKITPQDLSRWAYASKLLGHSYREMKEVSKIGEEMTDRHNDLAVRSRGVTFESFGDLRSSKPDKDIELPLLNSEITRKDDALGKLSQIASTLSREEIADLFQQQKTADKPVRITDLRQISRTPDGIKVTPAQDLRLSLKEAKAPSIEGAVAKPATKSASFER